MYGCGFNGAVFKSTFNFLVYPEEHTKDFDNDESLYLQHGLGIPLAKNKMYKENGEQ